MTRLVFEDMIDLTGNEIRSLMDGFIVGDIHAAPFYYIGDRLAVYKNGIPYRRYIERDIVTFLSVNPEEYSPMKSEPMVVKIVSIREGPPRCTIAVRLPEFD